MKTLFVGLVLISSNSFAHDSSHTSDSCNIDINGGVSISQSNIKFLKNDKSLYKIEKDHSLIINGEEVSLTSSQQSIITQFSTDIRALIPQAKNVATDALTLASEGVSLVFNELLGENNAVVEDLATHFNMINQEIEESFAMNKTVHFNEDGFSELLFSGGNMDAFETKMESFAEQMGYEMEVRSQDIEKRAYALCEALINIDLIEENMRNDIPELSKFNVLTISGENQNKA